MIFEGQIGLLIIAVTIGMVTLMSCGGSGDVSDGPSVKELEEKGKGFHYLDPWDGNHNGVEAIIRDRLNDPGSMETIETRIAPLMK